MGGEEAQQPYTPDLRFGSGHEAGYNWAEEHDIDNEDDCDAAGDTSNSPSFAEGCKAYVNCDSPDEEDNDEPENQTDSDDDPQHSAVLSVDVMHVIGVQWPPPALTASAW